MNPSNAPHSSSRPTSTPSKGTDPSQNSKKSCKHKNHTVDNLASNTEKQVQNHNAGSSNTPDKHRRSITSKVEDDRTKKNTVGAPKKNVLDKIATNEYGPKNIHNLTGMHGVIFENLVVEDNEIDIEITCMGDVPSAMQNSIKKHSSSWLSFQKLKRFMRTLFMRKNSINITSKDVKEIPDNMINILDPIDKPYRGQLQTEEPIVKLINQYNRDRQHLIKYEGIIDRYKNVDGNEQYLETIELSKKIAQDSLLAHSKSIVKYADAHIKYASTEIKKNFDSINEKEVIDKKTYTQFFDVLKSHIHFDTNKLSKTDKRRKEKTYNVRKAITAVSQIKSATLQQKKEITSKLTSVVANKKLFSAISALSPSKIDDVSEELYREVSKTKKTSYVSTVRNVNLSNGQDNLSASIATYKNYIYQLKANDIDNLDIKIRTVAFKKLHRHRCILLDTLNQRINIELTNLKTQVNDITDEKERKRFINKIKRTLSLNV